MDLNFNGDPFSINVEIWLPRSFPFQAPLLFIVPSGSQRLRPSATVDQAGRVNHSYLAYWHTRPNSTLIEMMNYLHPAFCQDPPIFLEQKPVPSPAQQAPPPPSVNRAQQPLPPPSLNSAQLKEELRRNLLARYGSLQTELASDTDRILAENTLLDQGEAKINKAITKLRENILTVQEETQQMSAKCASIEEMLAQLRSSGTLDVDRLVVPQGPISKQYGNSN